MQTILVLVWEQFVEMIFDALRHEHRCGIKKDMNLKGYNNDSRELGFTSQEIEEFKQCDKYITICSRNHIHINQKKMKYRANQGLYFFVTIFSMLHFQLRTEDIFYNMKSRDF